MTQFSVQEQITRLVCVEGWCASKAGARRRMECDRPIHSVPATEALSHPVEG